MKRVLIMLLIACSANTTISADPTAAPQKKPESVIATLNAIIHKFAKNEGQVYSVSRNPNTGIIESSIKIVPFHCSADRMRNDNVMNAVAMNFPKDEPLSYQFQHIQPGSNENISLKVIYDNGANQGTQRIRTKKNQEMWLMCCKNPENPQLRDAYAIVWEHTDEIDGTIYMISSLRPDMYEKNMSSAGLMSENKNTFTIDGRVGYDLKDSLYVVYMADTADELNNVRDSDFVAYMPVVNKRFSFSVQLDKPKVGRIRTVMPDGSLCHLWTNLDFVPGETYRITTHNGYYDEDRDYEKRVGRYSGKSLLNDQQRRGIDDQTFVVVEEVPEANRPKSWRNSLTPEQGQQLELTAAYAMMKMEEIKKLYEAISDELKGMRDGYKMDKYFDEILKKNKELDKRYQNVINLAKSFEIPHSDLPEAYKEILQFYTEQNQAINDLFKNYGSLSKSARKTQKCVNDLLEKYIKDLEKTLNN